jgi:hypothetical protein
MKTNIHFWSHLIQFFLEWKMFQTNVVDTIETHNLYSIFVFLKSCLLWDNVEKYCTVGQATDGNTVRHMCIKCWIANATDTRSEYVIVTAFPLQQWLHERAPILRGTYFAFLLISLLGKLFSVKVYKCI